MKNKKIIIICSILIFIISIIIIYIKTDFLKTKEQLFWKYMWKEKDEIVDILSNNTIEKYSEQFEESSYIKEGNISITSKNHFVKPIKIQINEKGNNQKENINTDISTTYNKKNIGKQVYMDIISRASKYLYITTPYLVLDYELLNALKYAANRGVKVKILLPHIPDKKYVYMLARVHYEELINDGIEIYEYKSGFIHAKMFISDDEIATIGTFNLDFRSLYLNFEDGIYLYKSETINEMKKDFLNTINKSIKITKQNVKQYSKIKLFIGEILRLIAPLT